MEARYVKVIKVFRSTRTVNLVSTGMYVHYSLNSQQIVCKARVHI